MAVAVGSLLFGRERTPSEMLPDYSGLGEGAPPTHLTSMRGTAAMTAFLLFVLGTLYGLDRMWLSQLWEFGL